MDKFFDVFELDTNATKEDVRKRYVFLIKKIHPDRNKDPKSNEQFIKLQNIYSILNYYIDHKAEIDYHNDRNKKYDEKNIKIILNAVTEYMHDKFHTNVDLVNLYESFITAL
jgi:hypothetical protein